MLPRRLSGETKRRPIMANRRFQRLQSLDKEVKILNLKITTDGSGDVTASGDLGVESVSHSANVYTITLEDKYSSLKGISVISGVAADWTVDASSFSSKQIDIEASAVQASTEIYVQIVVKNTDVL